MAVSYLSWLILIWVLRHLAQQTMYQPILPNFLLPRQNRVDNGMSEFKVNLTQVTDHQLQPVFVKSWVND